MNYNKLVTTVQVHLAAKGYDVGTIDGLMGPRTRKALLMFPNITSHWPEKRQVVGFIQLLCQEKKLEVGKVDGYWGPQTEWAYSQLEPGETWSRPADPDGWPMADKLQEYYGDVGTNQVRVNTPYPLEIAWVPGKMITRFSCHELVAVSLRKVLTGVLQHYGEAKIKSLGLDQFGGCLNVRKMRGGSKWSTHSWGIALDFDPARNRLRWGADKAQFAKPEYEAWWNCWEDEGWTSLGRAKNYDWMHVQATHR